MSNMTTITADNNKNGSSTRNRAPILNSPIPIGTFGRNLTSAECRALRKLGWTVSERYIVVRQIFDSGNIGIVYKPAKGKACGYYHCDIYVETK